jgi:hypothetical protein
MCDISGENEDEYASGTWQKRAVTGENSAPPSSRNMTSEPRAEIERHMDRSRVGGAGQAPLSGLDVPK